MGTNGTLRRMWVATQDNRIIIYEGSITWFQGEFVGEQSSPTAYKKRRGGTDRKLTVN